MQRLINEIVLAKDTVSLSNRLKSIVGLGGPESVASAMCKMGIEPRAAEYIEVQSKIDPVTEFAHGLSLRFVRDPEMPIEVINVSRVSYLVGQVLNGGFWQFAHNSGWNRYFIDGTRAALAAVGATEHLCVFNGAARIIDEAYANADGKVDSHLLEEEINRLESENFTDAKLSRRLSRSIDASWGWGDRWKVAQYLNLRYVEGLRGVRRIARAKYDAELDRLASVVPDLAVRKQAWEDARPWEKKAIERIVKQEGLGDVWYTTFSDRQHNGKSMWCWNFVAGPSRKHLQAIFSDGEAILFDGTDETVVAKAAAPECAPGSAVPRNEPRHEPGTGSFNVVTLISNP